MVCDIEPTRDQPLTPTVDHVDRLWNVRHNNTFHVLWKHGSTRARSQAVLRDYAAATCTSDEPCQQVCPLMAKTFRLTSNVFRSISKAVSMPADFTYPLPYACRRLAGVCAGSLARLATVDMQAGDTTRTTRPPCCAAPHAWLPATKNENETGSVQLYCPSPALDRFQQI